MNTSVRLMVLMLRKFITVSKLIIALGLTLPSVKQFKSKFGGLKKIRANEWKAVFSEIRRREAQGVKSDVYLLGRKLPLERIAREKRRYFRDCTVQKSHEIGQSHPRPYQIRHTSNTY